MNEIRVCGKGILAYLHFLEEFFGFWVIVGLDLGII